mgnify:CR=1 FL=1|jgi:uncharacterized membrane protein
MLKEYLLNYYSNNRGKVNGALIGLVLSILILCIGFFKTLLIALFVFGGYYIGKKVDNKEDIIEFLDRILPSGWDR